MTKWIDSKEGLYIILKHGSAMANDYQSHLEWDGNLIDWDEETGKPLDFETWLEEFEEQIEFENSDEFKNELIRLSEKDD